MRLRYGLVCGLLLLLIPGVTGSVLTPSTAWSPVSDPIACASDGVCVTDDTFNAAMKANLESENPQPELRLDSGSTGYCGFGGVQRTVTVPENADVINVVTSASKDRWAGRAGILLDGDWVVEYSTDNPDRQVWNREQHRIDVDEYGGETVPLTVAIEDTSDRWCNMADHDISITVHRIAFDGTASANTQQDTAFWLDVPRLSAPNLSNIPQTTRAAAVTVFSILLTALYIGGLKRVG